ncbi:AAA family ATPase [Ktedonospora formicarum]|uniref:Uncharacterized protein n=1 Tax=Ktedonospora formicarum TaxID=2778364 RepID=A0A8J3I3L7_9CHLR|nr:AAA family ATPase [Ktedonospora formicarum]GHO44839.1 hypothetical protein KSX_30020 [Ktedonospora formicarum]
MAQHYDDLFQRRTRSINTPITEFLPPAHFRVPMIIHNLLPTGLTLLTGASHSGRTSLALHLALDIATGEPALNSRVPSLHDDHQPYRTAFGSHIHYLALDSSEENLQQTTARLFKSRPSRPHSS